MEKNVHRLTEIWYSLISWNHHKDRDCHFYITVDFCAHRQGPVWSANHYGYLKEFDQDCATYTEALAVLRLNLKEIIAEEIKWHRANRPENPDRQDGWYDPSPFTLSKLIEIENEVAKL
jgi:hypothetical protein